MLFVEAPALRYGDPIEIHDVKDLIEGLDSTLEVRGVGLSEVEAVFLKESPSLLCFFYALLGEVYICPAREAVLLVPYALTMAYEYDSLHNRILLIG